MNIAHWTFFRYLCLSWWLEQRYQVNLLFYICENIFFAFRQISSYQKEMKSAVFVPSCWQRNQKFCKVCQQKIFSQKIWSFSFCAIGIRIRQDFDICKSNILCRFCNDTYNSEMYNFQIIRANASIQKSRFRMEIVC